MEIQFILSKTYIVNKFWRFCGLQKSDLTSYQNLWACLSSVWNKLNFLFFFLKSLFYPIAG